MNSCASNHCRRGKARRCDGERDHVGSGASSYRTDGALRARRGISQKSLVRVLVFIALAISAAFTATSARAHGFEHHDDDANLAHADQPASAVAPQSPWRTWGWEPGSMIGLALSATLYGTGLRRLWRVAGVGHGIRRWEAGCFAAGWIVLFVALISPIHPLGQALFWVHMMQHELLMLAAAPLLVLGKPTVVFLRAVGPRMAHALGRFSNSRGWQSVWGVLSAPLMAWGLHAAVLWGWHAPALFQATLHNEWVHAAQHVSFLATALLFWWAVLHARGGAASYGAGVLYLFTTAIHSGFLGALLTFARTSWYPDYARTTGAWGLSALEDQQIGGLVMWVPACSVYIAAGLFLFARWMGGSSRRSRFGKAIVGVKTSGASSAVISDITM